MKLQPLTSLVTLAGLLALSTGCASSDDDALAQDLAAASRIVAIGSGAGFSCALAKGGTVSCWGSNDSDQLGRGAYGYSASSKADAVVGLRDAVALSVGHSHACAVKKNATVVCWGNNKTGQLGDATTGNTRNTPVAVLGLTQVASVSAGRYATCALKIDGSLFCWGNNNHGELGVSSSADLVLTPTRVRLDRKVTSVSTGEYTTCAEDADGFAACWGYGVYGAIGNGSGQILNYRDPRPTARLTGFGTAVSVGSFSACETLRDGTATCWGENRFGKLGTGSAQSQVSVPQPVFGLRDVRKIVTSAFHACAVTKGSGKVYCWGSGNDLSLGVPRVDTQATPVEAISAGNAIDVSVGYSFTCALRKDNTVWCWGQNDIGQLGVAGAAFSAAPVHVVFP